MKRRTRRALEKGMMEIYPPDEWTGAPKTAQQLLDEAYLWEHHGYHDMAEILRAAAIDLESTTTKARTTLRACGMRYSSKRASSDPREHAEEPRVNEVPSELTVAVHMEGGSYWAEVVELPGCFAAGDTFGELQESLQEAIELYLDIKVGRLDPRNGWRRQWRCRPGR